MTNVTQFFTDLYDNFNARRIEKVIAHLTTNVQWANGMDGGFVFGHDGVREYWTRQFKQVSSKVIPMEIHELGSTVTVQVHQVVHDLNNKLLGDSVLNHVFTLDHDKINKFEIEV